jgi:hypothetical protein
LLWFSHRLLLRHSLCRYIIATTAITNIILITTVPHRNGWLCVRVFVACQGRDGK